jgi:hypothetical protein
MEDWAYAASWEPPSVIRACSPTSYGGYPAARTSNYQTEAGIKTLIYLIEMSDNKVRAMKENYSSDTEDGNYPGILRNEINRNN